jgi:hypothetical protein
MPSEWEERIADPRERKVLEALSDPEWDFRTVAGISKATGLLEPDVTAVLEKYPDLVRKSPVPDAKGRELYTLRSRSIGAREFLAQARTIISKTLM